MTSLYFHEDDYCQIQVLPGGCRDWCQSELGRLEAFAVAHRDGIGYTDLYMRQEPPIPLSELGIGRDQFVGLLRPFLPRAGHVETGYGEYREPCDNVVGFGDQETAIYAEEREGIIQAIWVNGNPNWARLVAPLMAMGAKWNLILVDWEGRVLHDLNQLG